MLPTKETYDALYAAFAHFNKELFDNRLPDAVLVLHRKRGAHGYFWPERWADRDDADQALKLDEIALNPETMGRTIEEVLSTLVHEMTHLEQQHYGTPGKGGNHNKEWGELMDRVGLTPTSTGLPGGKRTGRKVTHMIVEDGPYAASLARYIASGGSLPLFAIPAMPGAKKKDMSKVKFTCPHCDAKAWAKHDARLICGDCDADMQSELE